MRKINVLSYFFLLSFFGLVRTTLRTHNLRIPAVPEFEELEKYYLSLKKLYTLPGKLTDSQRRQLESIGFGSEISPVHQKRLSELRSWLST